MADRRRLRRRERHLYCPYPPVLTRDFPNLPDDLLRTTLLYEKLNELTDAIVPLPSHQFPAHSRSTFKAGVTALDDCVGLIISPFEGHNPPYKEDIQRMLESPFPITFVVILSRLFNFIKAIESPKPPVPWNWRQHIPNFLETLIITLLRALNTLASSSELLTSRLVEHPHFFTIIFSSLRNTSAVESALALLEETILLPAVRPHLDLSTIPNLSELIQSLSPTHLGSFCRVLAPLIEDRDLVALTPTQYNATCGIPGHGAPTDAHPIEPIDDQMKARRSYLTAESRALRDRNQSVVLAIPGMLERLVKLISVPPATRHELTLVDHVIRSGVFTLNFEIPEAPQEGGAPMQPGPLPPHFTQVREDDADLAPALPVQMHGGLHMVVDLNAASNGENGNEYGGAGTEAPHMHGTLTLDTMANEALMDADEEEPNDFIANDSQIRRTILYLLFRRLTGIDAEDTKLSGTQNWDMLDKRISRAEEQFSKRDWKGKTFQEKRRRSTMNSFGVDIRFDPTDPQGIIDFTPTMGEFGVGNIGNMNNEHVNLHPEGSLPVNGAEAMSPNAQQSASTNTAAAAEETFSSLLESSHNLQEEDENNPGTVQPHEGVSDASQDSNHHSDAGGMDPMSLSTIVTGGFFATGEEYDPEDSELPELSINGLLMAAHQPDVLSVLYFLLNGRRKVDVRKRLMRCKILSVLNRFCASLDWHDFSVESKVEETLKVHFIRLLHYMCDELDGVESKEEVHMWFSDREMRILKNIEKDYNQNSKSPLSNKARAPNSSYSVSSRRRARPRSPLSLQKSSSPPRRGWDSAIHSTRDPTITDTPVQHVMNINHSQQQAPIPYGLSQLRAIWFPDVVDQFQNLDMADVESVRHLHKVGDTPEDIGLVCRLTSILMDGFGLSCEGNNVRRFQISGCLENFLRGASVAQKTLIAREGLLLFLLQDLSESITKPSASNQYRTTCFDLLGQLVKWNRVLFSTMNAFFRRYRYLFPHLLQAVSARLVDSNVFIRAIIISLERFRAEDEAMIKCGEENTLHEPYDFDNCLLWEFIESHRSQLLHDLISSVKVEDVNFDNICCINTTLFLLVTSCSTPEDVNELLIEVSEIARRTHDEGQNPADLYALPPIELLHNLKRLIDFWLTFYRHQNTDVESQEVSSTIHFEELVEMALYVRDRIPFIMDHVNQQSRWVSDSDED